MVIIKEQCTTISKAVPLEAAKEDVDESVVSYRIAGGMQYLEPEHVVSKSVEPEKVLEEAAPVTATLWVAGNWIIR